MHEKATSPLPSLVNPSQIVTLESIASFLNQKEVFNFNARHAHVIVCCNFQCGNFVLRMPYNILVTELIRDDLPVKGEAVDGWIAGTRLF